MRLIEIQVDRLVGPTHHFSGLGVGNLASQTHAGQVSNPAAAAIQGLDKMRLVASLGIPQFVLPPQPRPNFDLLRQLGFRGSDAEVAAQSHEQAPDILSATHSCSAMWTANAATVTPGIDRVGDDRTTLLTVANLTASLHRSIEPAQTERDLRQLLPAEVIVTPPIPGGDAMRDEGAANHMRIASRQSHRPALNVFVYGDETPAPTVHFPRQSRAACEAVARIHRIEHASCFLKQHPAAIDAGAFHNDVVAMSHYGLLIHHEQAFLADPADYDRLQTRFREATHEDLHRVEVSSSELTIDQAVSTYLFNSQILSVEPGTAPALICASQVRDLPESRRLVDRWRDEGIFRSVDYVDLDQSMSGGGGPACLRLRIPLAESTIERCRSQWRWSESFDRQLRELIRDRYPTRVKLEDLADADFHQQILKANAALRKHF